MENRNDPEVIRAMERLEEAKRRLAATPHGSDERQSGEMTAPAATAPEGQTPTQPTEPRSTADVPMVQQEQRGEAPKSGTLEFYRDLAERLRREKDEVGGRLGDKLKIREREKEQLEHRIGELERQLAAKTETGDGTRQTAAGTNEGRQVLDAEKAREILASRMSGDWDSYDDTEVVALALPLHELEQRNGPVVEIERRLEEIERSAAYDRFCIGVEKIAPGFIAAQGNPRTGQAADPGWVAFLNEPLFDGGTQTRGEYLGLHGTESVTAGMFREFLERGRAGSGAAPKSEIPLPSGIEAQVAPVQTTGTPADGGQKRFSKAVVDRFIGDMNNRRIPCTKENIEKFREYKLAVYEGRVG